MRKSGFVRFSNSEIRPQNATFPYLFLILILRSSGTFYLRQLNSAVSEIKRLKARKNVIVRLSRDEEQKLIKQAYRETSTHGLLLKTLFLTGARVSEFVSLKVTDLFFDEQMILIEKGKGGKSRYVPLLSELAPSFNRKKPF